MTRKPEGKRKDAPPLRRKPYQTGFTSCHRPSRCINNERTKPLQTTTEYGLRLLKATKT